LHDALNFAELKFDIRGVFLDPDKNFPDVDFLSSASEVANVLGSFVSGLVIENVKDILLDA